MNVINVHFFNRHFAKSQYYGREPQDRMTGKLNAYVTESITAATGFNYCMKDRDVLPR